MNASLGGQQGPPSKADALQKSAEQTAADKAPEASGPDCPEPEWTVQVRVKSTEKEDWPRSSVDIQLHLDSKIEYEFAEQMESIEGKVNSGDGKGQKTFQPTVSVDEWQEAQGKHVESIPLPAMDKKTVDLFIERMPWIKVRVEPFDKNTILTGVTVKLNLPGKDDTQDTTADKELSYGGLKPGKAKVTGVESDGAEIWEVVSCKPS